MIVLARLIAGREMDEGYDPPDCCELAAVTRRLAGLPPEARPPVWAEFLGGMEDHDAHGLRQAIARCPLDGPLPEHDAPAPDVTPASPRNGAAAAVPEDTPWGSIRISELPAAAPFPVDALPPVAARLVTEGAAAIGCPPDFLGLSVLAVASGAIGRSASLRVKSNYFVGAALYAANVGPPSDGKTPALAFASGAIRRIDAMLKAEHDQAVELWRESSEPEGGKGRKGPVSKPPRPRRIVIDDATIEAMALLLADNPRGLIMERDELTALLMGMNQYKAGGKGSDRANLLKVWAGQAITRDRVAHESNIPIRCPHPFLTIIGGMTPDMLPELSDRKGRSDGFLDRFLMAYPEPLPVPDWQEDGLDSETADEWARLVTRLWKRPLDRTDGGQEHPHVLRLQGNALDAMRERINAHAREMNASDFSDDLRGAWGKFRDYAARLALILVLMDHASDPTADEAALPELGARHVRDAWRLIDYFKVMAVRVRLAIAGGPALGGSAVSRVVLKWVRSNGLAEFTESELGQARRKLTDAQRGDALAELAKLNVIRPAPRREPSPNGGRPPSPSWVVNPSLLETRNPENPGNPP